jgi:hypothetical protein
VDESIGQAYATSVVLIILFVFLGQFREARRRKRLVRIYESLYRLIMVIDEKERLSLAYPRLVGRMKLDNILVQMEKAIDKAAVMTRVDSTRARRADRTQ